MRFPTASLVTLTLIALAGSHVAAQAQDVVGDLTAYADVDSTLHVRWTTTAPSRCQVDWGPAGATPATVEEGADLLRGTTNNRDAGTGWANNHRVDIPAVKTWPLQVVVRGQTREGAKFATAPLTVAGATMPAGAVARATVPIRIHPGGWQLDRLPITVGVPFPRGALAGPSHARVLCQGQELASQRVATVRWHADGSVKWLRIDCVVPRETETVTLEYGREIVAAAGGPAVDPGATPAAPAPAAMVLVDAAGKTYRGRVDRSAEEEAGPVKAVQRTEGAFVAEDGSKLCAFVIRCHRWQGLPLARIDYTFENDNTAAEFTPLRSLELVGPATGRDEVQVGEGAAAVAVREGERVLQREDNEWVREPGSTTGKRLSPIIRAGEAEVAFFPHLWEQWPLSVAVRGGAMVLGVLPALPPGFYADRKDEDKLYYHLRDGLHTLRQGFTRTWQVWVGPQAPGPAAGLEAGPIATVPPQWIEDSGALRKLAVSVRDQFTGYDEALARGIERYGEARDAAREYGMMNFGDWYGERTWNWGNLEYDLGHGLLTQYARSGKPEFYWRAEECLRHERDVDTRHYAADPRRIGQQWTHCMGHTAGYYPATYKDMKVYAAPGWSDNRGHVWAQGMFEHYLLGGDTRSWETGRLIADWAAGPQATNFIFGNAREPGWMTKLVMAAYFATEDPFYLNAAKIMLGRVHEQSLKSGDHGFYYHKLDTGHCNCPDQEKHWGEAGFMLGVLMTGMKMYYDVTGDEEVAADIVKTARFIVDTMWVPEQFGFRYTSCPRTGAGAGSSWIMMEGLAFAARHANDERLAAVCRNALAAAWSSIPTTGKSAGYVICSSAQALEETARLPGPDFGSFRAALDRLLRSPVRRPLPGNLPNPDFETGPEGYLSRGVAMERCTEVAHSGSACLKLSGKLARQNEYIVTRYDAAGSPEELTWLKAGQTYRLSAWLRVDRISAGAPAPDLRLAFRDDTGTRGAQATTAYDLTRPQTWQKLTADIKLPEWNSRNYIALNTNTKAEVEVEMYLDDLSLVPVGRAAAEQYVNLRLDPAAATLRGGAQVGVSARLAGDARLVGPGEATWRVTVPAAGPYGLWAKVEADTPLAGALVDGKPLPGPRALPDDAWVLLGKPVVAAGEVTITLPRLPAGARVGRLVLTNDPSAGG